MKLVQYNEYVFSTVDTDSITSYNAEYAAGVRRRTFPAVYEFSTYQLQQMMNSARPLAVNIVSMP